MAYPSPAPKSANQSAIAMIMKMCIVIICSLPMAAASVHDILPMYKLPKGLLPREINSCCLYNADDTFTMEVSSNPCYVRYTVNGYQQVVVYFDRIIKGKLSTGKVSGVSGIMAKIFFVWVNISGIDVDQEKEMLEFHAGPFSQKFPAKDFEEIRSCRSCSLSSD